MPHARGPRRRRRRGRRAANCSVRTAFALYAGAALLAGIALSFVSTGLLGLAAEATLPADPYACSGTYVYDAGSNELVPAEALSWYETAAYDAAIEGDAPGSDSLVLYVASKGSGCHLGLGLYVARTLAERHGGLLELSNRSDGGALVRVRVLAPETSQRDENATSR